GRRRADPPRRTGGLLLRLLLRTRWVSLLWPANRHKYSTSWLDAANANCMGPTPKGSRVGSPSASALFRRGPPGPAGNGSHPALHAHPHAAGGSLFLFL